MIPGGGDSVTVDEAIRRTQDRAAGAINRLSVRYAEEVLQKGEEPLAAVVANVTTSRGHFPGVAMVTDRRALAVCGLPGIKRVAQCGAGWTCREDPSALRHMFIFSDGKTTFSITIDPDTGARFSRRLASLNGEEAAYDAAVGGVEGGLFNPALLQSKRWAKQKEAARRKAADDAAHLPAEEDAPSQESREDTRETALRLERQLQQAKTQETVADTDPRAVAARLARELLENEDQ